MRAFTPEEQEQYTKSINKVYKPTGYNIYGKRELTPEEKELIVNTPITFECFEMDDFDELDRLPLIELEDVRCTIRTYWEWALFPMLEKLRQKYNETKDKLYWKELIRLLPNSYKVVKL